MERSAEHGGAGLQTAGDNLIPDLMLDGAEELEEMPLGKCGMLRETFLEDHHHGTYTSMLLTGRLYLHLREIDRQAQEQVDRMVADLKKRNGVDEAMKARDQMRWVQAVNSFTAQQQIPTPAGFVPSAVIGRALTSGSNEQHSIERIVAFFQKNPLGSAASFMAKEQNLMPVISQHFLGKGFPEDTKEIAELLKFPVHRQQILKELDAFVDVYKYRPDLLRFRKIHNPVELLRNIGRLSAVKEQYQAVEGFAPVKPSFVTEDEITHLLKRGGDISEAKLRIYACFKQGHDAKECAQFLKESYGEGGGYGYQNYNENHDTKGISLTRSDEESGYKGYDTATLNWNQVQKRVRALIDSGQYLNSQEKAYLPAYEKVTLARRIYHFYSMAPNRTNPPGNDMDAAVKKIRDILDSDDPEKEAELFHEMFSIMAAVSPDSPAYQRMAPVLRDMEAFKRDEYSLYDPLPESVLQAERQAKEAGRKAPATQLYTSRGPARCWRPAGGCGPRPGE